MMGKMKHKRRVKHRKSERDEDIINEGEYIKLKRKLRIMENDKKAYSQEVNTVLRKQSREINILQNENNSMQESLSVAYGKSRLMKDTEQTTQLRNLVEARDDYASLMDLETNTCAELDVKINNLRGQVENFRKQMGGETGVRDTKINTMRNINRLENKVDKLTRDFCTQLSHNEKMRENIRLLVQEKTIYKDLYDRLTDRINAYKSRIMDVTKEATGHYEQRLEAMSKMKTLRERSAKDEAVFQAEMKILQRMIAHDTRLKDFMNTKENERSEFKAEEAEKKAKTSFKEKALNEELQHVQKFENLFENVKRVTGHDDLQVVVTEFTAKDEENFSRFDYVSELNNDVEKLREEIQQIKDNIKRVREEDKHMQTGRDEMIAELRQTQEILSKDLVQEENKLASVNEKMEAVCGSVHLLFKRIDCSSDIFKSSLGYEDKVDAANIVVYLGHIEQRTIELIGIQQFLLLHQDPHGNLLRQPRSMHRIRPRGASKIFLQALDKPSLPNIMVPSINDDMSADIPPDELNQPMDIESLRQRAMKKIAKKEAAGLLTQPLFVQDKRKIKPKKK